MPDRLQLYVACRECRTAGRLHGGWFVALEAPETVQQLDATPYVAAIGHTAVDGDGPHEHLVVLDHIGFGRRLTGDVSVSDAKRIARDILGES